MQNWIFYDEDNTIINSIAVELGISTLTAAILFHRGINEPDSARKFLAPETRQEFYDPFSMKDMTLAVERIKRALDRNEKIVVYGDYDVDGMTASAILIKCLRRFGADVDSYIPSRQTEGYGFNVDALNRLAGQYDLLISVDCGITNNVEIDAVRERLDIIVTDHHLPIDPIENAVAVIDPHQPDCAYPDKNLCGAGVAFKLCQALNAALNRIDYREYVEDVELAALGTVADLVPLLGENRKIVRLGLERMPRTSIVGLRELIGVAGLNGKKITAGHCGFNLGPRLNAVGRLESASIGLKLLLTDDAIEARQLALKLDRENTLRKEIERKMLEEADEEFQRLRAESGGGMSSIVIAREGWHKGVIGLTASKLLEKYYLPTIIIALDEELAVGSCRSIGALHMKDALDQFGERFEHYGGHAAAAGFSMPREAWEKFAADFDEYVRSTLDEKDFIPTQKIEAEIHPTEIELKLAEELSLLAPFGIGNPHPKFGCRNVKGFGARTMGGNGQHLSFQTESPEAFSSEQRDEPYADELDEEAVAFSDLDAQLDQKMFSLKEKGAASESSLKGKEAESSLKSATSDPFSSEQSSAAPFASEAAAAEPSLKATPSAPFSSEQSSAETFRVEATTAEPSLKATPSAPFSSEQSSAETFASAAAAAAEPSLKATPFASFSSEQSSAAPFASEATATESSLEAAPSVPFSSEQSSAETFASEATAVEPSLKSAPSDPFSLEQSSAETFASEATALTFREPTPIFSVEADEKFFAPAPNAFTEPGVDELDEDAAAFNELDAQAERFDHVDELNDFIEGFDETDSLSNQPSSPIENKKKIRAIGWGMGAMVPLVNGEPIDITFEPTINEFNGEQSVECLVNSIEPCGTPDQFPDRETLGRIYKFLRSRARDESFRPFDVCKLTEGFRNSTAASDDPKLNSIFTMTSAIKVFSELGLLRFDVNGKNFSLPTPKRKLDLNRSRIFKLNIKGDAHE